MSKRSRIYQRKVESLNKQPNGHLGKNDERVESIDKIAGGLDE
ncbi:hypothetical protein [Paenibacillus sp. Marseille-Q7038]